MPSKVIAQAVIAELEGQINDLKAEIKAREAQLQSLQANPPMVANLTAKGLTQIRDLIFRISGTGSAANVTPKEAEDINSALSAIGGVWVTLESPATGGTTPPPIYTKDIAQFAAKAIATARATGEWPSGDEILALARERFGGQPGRIAKPKTKGASTKAQTIAVKLIDRPELATEVLSLLLAAGVEP